ncbi:MAG TPA: response regulator transcription factor [Thermomicrobiaceae bacterium]|nr:response regulator transcription factor [Thermomicrobiaceae bacterium]
MSDDAIRIVVADDHDLFREGLRQLLETIPAVEIVGEAADGQEAIRLVAELHPDVVLMDINMPRVDGLRATEYIVKHFPTTNVVVLTMYQDDEYAIHAIRAGAKSYLLKNSRSDEVIKAIQVASDGGSTIDATLAPALMREYHRLLTKTPSTNQRHLSEREAMLLRLLASGFNNRQIADNLDLAESTVKNNLSALFQKIGVRDRTQAALYAISQGYAAKTSEPV